MDYARAHGRGGAARAYYAANLLPWLLRKVRLISEDSYHRPIISRLAWLIKGMNAQALQSVFDWLFHERILPTERAEVVARLRDHQARGHAVVLVSAMFTPSLEQRGAHYGATGVLGTRIEMQDGRCSGRVLLPVNTGADKERYARAFFASRGTDVDWEASHAYADSITDTGLLGLVGHPVAVHPDPRLHALAQQKGWEILGEARAER
jgi:HAD superfamily hydrolase (TIGR01490 family)